MEQTKLIMKQMSKYRWSLFAPKGHALVDNIYQESAYSAEVWVKAYVSSWTTWTYRMEKL